MAKNNKPSGVFETFIVACDNLENEYRTYSKERRRYLSEKGFTKANLNSLVRIRGVVLNSMHSPVRDEKDWEKQDRENQVNMFPKQEEVMEVR